MRKIVATAALLAVASATSVAQNHDTKYLMGGYASTSTLYTNGVWLGDAQAQSYQHLTPNTNVYYARTIRMDGNNKDVIFTAEGTTSTTYASWLRSGLYRLNPGTGAISTIYHSTLDTYAARHVITNQDGDYVFTSYHSTSPATPTTRTYSIMKVDAASNLTTVFSSANAGAAFTGYGLGRDIDSGHYLVNAYASGKFYYAVLKVAEDGTFTTFAGGPNSTDYGWYGYYSKLQQNIGTGDLEGHYYRNLYRLKKGSAGPRTTLWQLGLPGGYTMRYGSLTDNQSAATPRFIASGYRTTLVNGVSTNLPCMFSIDAKPPYAVTATEFDPTNANGKRYNYSYGFDFYRGRHVQPAKIAPQTWDILFSCPRHAGKSYVAAVSLAGVRPATRLPDGRRIHLQADMFTQLSVSGNLWPFFHHGSGTLNANGEAYGRLNLSAFGKMGLPMWVQLIVLDPNAPSGISYIPDPYVMRV